MVDVYGKLVGKYIKYTIHGVFGIAMEYPHFGFFGDLLPGSLTVRHRDFPKWNGSSFKHHVSGVMLDFGGVKSMLIGILTKYHLILLVFCFLWKGFHKIFIIEPKSAKIGKNTNLNPPTKH